MPLVTWRMFDSVRPSIESWARDTCELDTAHRSAPQPIDKTFAVRMRDPLLFAAVNEIVAKLLI
jgi:hypothetical protein